MKRILIVLAGVVLLLVVSSFLIGFGVEGVYRQVLIESADAEGVRVAGEIQRGVLSSDAETLLTLETGDPEEPVIRVTHHIVHGPLLIGGGSVSFGLALIESRIDADEDQLPGLAELLNGRALVQADTHVGFGGRLKSLIHSPSIESEDGSFSFEGARGDLVFEPAQTSGNGRFHVGALKSESGGERVELAGMSGEFHAELGPDGQTGPFSGRVEVGSVDVASAGTGFSVAPSTSTFSGQLQAGLGAGESKTSVGDIHIRHPGGGASAITGLSLVQQQESIMEAGRTLLNAHSSVGFDVYDAAGRVYRDGRLDMVVSRFDSEAWQALQSAGEPPPQTEAELMAMQTRIMTELLPAALASSPSFEIEKLSVTGDSGELDGRMLIAVDGSDPSALGNPLMLLSKVRAEAKLRAPAPMMHALVDALLSSEEEGDPYVIKTRVISERTALLEKLVNDGTLILDGDTYSIDAKLQNGFPMFNGAPADPSFLMGVVPGF